ncbi:M23 family metallopeptidase [Microbacterium sp. AG238]|uniref:M23 family metallopeptidase n=1 Tax=Microbacterium sp. AG238 TaxID=2183994 RepID=UPI000E756BC2|nr:M23 family metallopeptidase [Microbacterium sp. AG238]
MYGPRDPIYDPDYGWTRAFHLGQDWNIGGSVHAIAPGVVIEAGRGGDPGVGGESWMGLQVLIDHGIVEGRRLYTRSCHMSRLSVSKGSWIPEGTQLGIEGQTGLSRGVHLHLEMYLDGTWRASGTDPGNTIAPIPYITNHLSDPQPEPEDDMYDQNARNELFAELRKLTEEIKRFASPLKLFTYGTGIVAVNPQTGKSMVLSAGYPELLAHLGYAGGGAPVVEQGQLNYATNYVGDAVGIPSLKLSGMSAQTIAEVERTVAENRVALSQDQYDRIVDEVAAAVRADGVDGVEKALSARTTVIAPIEA